MVKRYQGEKAQADECLTLFAHLFIELGATDCKDLIQSMIAAESLKKIRELVINIVEEADRDNV